MIYFYYFCPQTVKTLQIMKKILFTCLLVSAGISLSAQHHVGSTFHTTLYETYQPARITLSSGKVIMQKQANVFLKNARLVFKSGRHDMLANMNQVQKVEFADKSFVRLDTMLAEVADVVGTNRILCTTTIDLDAYNSQKINDRIISNFQIGTDQVSATSIDTSPSDELFPLVRTYYFEIDGKIVKTHERTLRRMLPKAKRSRFDFYLQLPDFSWYDVASLRKVLELFEK